MDTTIKTLDIQAKEWFDKVNGNSYFSAQIHINYGMPTAQVLYLPFQYGYDSQYEFEAKGALQMAGILPRELNRPLWYYCEKNNIKYNASKRDKCLKRDVKAFGSN